MKKLVFPVLIMALFFGNVQKANANPITAYAVKIVGSIIYDAANRFLGEIENGLIKWKNGEEQDVQDAEKESPLDFDGDGDSNGDGYNG